MKKRSYVELGASSSSFLLLFHVVVAPGDPVMESS